MDQSAQHSVGGPASVPAATAMPRPAGTEAGTPVKAKKTPRAPRQAMPEQSPRRRASNFLEVPKGYSPEVAIVEATRCLKCPKPLCVLGCPVNIDIPGFVSLIAEGKFEAAAQKLKEQ